MKSRVADMFVVVVPVHCAQGLRVACTCRRLMKESVDMKNRRQRREQLKHREKTHRQRLPLQPAPTNNPHAPPPTTHTPKPLMGMLIHTEQRCVKGNRFFSRKKLQQNGSRSETAQLHFYSSETQTRKEK